MRKITNFEIHGLFGSRDISLQINDNRLVIVGPNGIGKSSVASVFYLFLSRQWSRLLEYNFDTVRITIGGKTSTITREDISGLSVFKGIAGDFRAGTRAKRIIDQLILTDRFEQFITLKRLTPKQAMLYSDILRISSPEVTSFHRFLRGRASDEDDLLNIPRFETETALKNQIKERILYLPTYRRIEKDIKDIFPDFERKLRVHDEEINVRQAGRAAGHYIELVSFGMEDVKDNIHDRTDDVRNYSLSQYNELAVTYLRDVIQGRADQFIAKEINSLTDEDMSDILARVSEETLTDKEKDLLRKKVKGMQGKKKSEIEPNDRYLAHYFTKLVSVRAEISRQEQDINSFIEVCNKYLRPSKWLEYDKNDFSVRVVTDEKKKIDLSVLSSGEKQIVSIFAHLYLDQDKEQIIIIDEPELSLSVPWQKLFLPDIAQSGRCGFLLAVTHSPFIFDNSLGDSARDLRQMTTAT